MYDVMLPVWRNKVYIIQRVNNYIVARHQSRDMPSELRIVSFCLSICLSICVLVPQTVKTIETIVKQ